MSQQNKGNQPVRIPSEDVFKQILENEARKIDIAEKKLSIERDTQKMQYEYAIRSLDANKDLMKNQPSEKRKTYLTIGFIASVFVGIFTWFVIYCLDNGKEAFVIDLIKVIGWLISVILSFFAGKKVGGNEKPRELSDSQEVQ